MDQIKGLTAQVRALLDQIDAVQVAGVTEVDVTEGGSKEEFVPKEDSSDAGAAGSADASSEASAS